LTNKYYSVHHVGSFVRSNHYLLHLVGLSFTYLSKMHGHSNIKFKKEDVEGSDRDLL